MSAYSALLLLVMNAVQISSEGQKLHYCCVQPEHYLRWNLPTGYLRPDIQQDGDKKMPEAINSKKLMMSKPTGKAMHLHLPGINCRSSDVQPYKACVWELRRWLGGRNPPALCIFIRPPLIVICLLIFFSYRGPGLKLGIYVQWASDQWWKKWWNAGTLFPENIWVGRKFVVNFTNKLTYFGIHVWHW